MNTQYDWSIGRPVQTDNTNFEWVLGMPYIYYDHAIVTFIKSINGLVKASIKSKNGLAIASVKSINGLT